MCRFIVVSTSVLCAAWLMCLFENMFLCVCVRAYVVCMSRIYYSCACVCVFLCACVCVVFMRACVRCVFFMYAVHSSAGIYCIPPYWGGVRVSAVIVAIKR